MLAKSKIIDKNLLKRQQKFPNNKIQFGPIATQINDLKEIKNIEILGRFHSKIPKLLSTFKVALIPYIKLYRQYFPAKLSEYLSMGMPCVSTNLQEVSNFNKKIKLNICSKKF